MCIGALVGEATSLVLENCSVGGTVKGGALSSVVGGLVGNIYAAENEYRYPNRLTLTDCYNTGTVSSSNASSGTGGVLGRGVTKYGSSIVLNNCFSTGGISGGTNCAVLGKNECIISGYNRQYSVTVNSCYYLAGSAANGCDISTATALDVIQMVKESTYTNFDFVNTWKMSSHHPVFSWQPASVPPTISNSDIIRLVTSYTSQDLYEQYEEIMYGDRYDSVQEKHEQLQWLFQHYGLTDVQEGIDYLSDTTGERRAYLGLMTDEMYTATNYNDWLSRSIGGGFFRVLLIADGLAFNNELNDYLSFPTYIEGNYPGVKKYKAMLYDFLDTAANEIELQTYVKTLSDISIGITGEVKNDIEALIESMNKAGSAAEQKHLIKDSKIWDDLAESSLTGVVRKGDDGPKFIYHCNETSGIAQYARAMDIVGTGVSLLDVSLTNFLSMQQLDARLKAYVQFKDFLETIRTDTAHIPYEMRWAAELVMKEMDEGYGLAMRNLVVELLAAAKLNDKVLSAIAAKLDVSAGFSAYLVHIQVAAFFVNGLVNLGETVQNVTFVEGYASAAQTYKSKLQDAEHQFRQNPTEVNAWNFVYNYNMLYLLREKGELAYIDLADTDGIAQKMADHAFSANRAVAQKTLDLLRSDFRFDISGLSDVPESVQYLSKMVVNCPVDVHVYDPQGELIITLKDGVESDVTIKNGKLTAVGNGTATITAVSGDDHDIKAVCTVTVAGHSWSNGICRNCGDTCSHTGGTATCTAKAVCTTCGAAYGELRDSHADADSNNRCDDCGKRLKASSAVKEENSIHSHNWILTMVKGTTHHWYECSTCGAKDEYAPHSYNADGSCTVCGYYSPADAKADAALPNDSAGDADLPAEENEPAAEEDAASTGGEQSAPPADSESTPEVQEPESHESDTDSTTGTIPESSDNPLSSESIGNGSVYAAAAVGAAVAGLILAFILKSRKRKAE